MSTQEKAQIRSDLKGCNSMAEMVNYLSNYYDLTGPVPPFAKMLLVEGLITGMGYLDPKKKK